MESEQSVNPYSFTEAAAVEEAPLGNRMPMPLAVLAVLLLLMGGTGIVLNVLAGVVLAVQAAAPSMRPAEETDRQQELERRIEANNAGLLPATGVSLVINFLLSIPMIVGAIGLFLRKERARVLSLRTIYANAVVAALEIPFIAVMFYLQSSLALALVEEAAASSPTSEFGRTIMYVVFGVQIVFMLALYVYEFALYWFGASYLRRDAVQAIFS